MSLVVGRDQTVANLKHPKTPTLPTNLAFERWEVVQSFREMDTKCVNVCGGG